MKAERRSSIAMELYEYTGSAARMLSVVSRLLGMKPIKTREK